MPVTHGDKPLRADSAGLMGKRLQPSHPLRDHARRVLASQNEGWSEAHRQQARVLLNRAYDRFVASFGYQQDDHRDERGRHAIRRMPNLVKFGTTPTRCS